jgi:hypothetical protein
LEITENYVTFPAMNANSIKSSEQLGLQMAELESSLSSSLEGEPAKWIESVSSQIVRFRSTLKEALTSSVARSVEVDLSGLFANAAGAACLNIHLYHVLTAAMKKKAGASSLVQTAAYRLVDIWGRNASSRALVLQLVGEISEGHATMTRDKAKASVQVLFEGLQSDFDGIIVELGKLGSFTRYAPLADKMEELLGSAQAAGLGDAILKEIEQLNY